MKVTLVTTSIGILALDEKNKLIAKNLFPKNPQQAAKTLLKIEAGKMTAEFTKLINKLKKSGYKAFIFENASIAEKAKENLNINVEVSHPSKAGEFLRSCLEKFAIETGFVKDSVEFRLWIHNLSTEIAKMRVKVAVEKRDLLITQAIQTLDDLDKTINLFMSRIREWYGIHFPELDRLLDKHETYIRLVYKLGSKENFTQENLKKLEIPKVKVEQIVKASKTSMGADLTETDLSQIQTLCKNVMELYDLRESLESYLDNTMKAVAPNIKALVGSLLGARLIAIAGGLTNLARRPASTIQVLGAEKALFRSLKTGTRPPKHGIIFQHAYLHEAKKWQRGKIARALAGKIAIAARTDAFGGRYIGDELKADLEKRIEEIYEKYSAPSHVPEKTMKRGKKRRKKRHGH